MNQLPIWLEIPIVLFGIAAGRFYGKQLHRRGVTLGASMQVRNLPLLPLALLGFTTVLILHNVVISHPQLSWYLPTTLEFYLQPFMWALQLVFVLFTMSAVTTLGFETKRRLGFIMLIFTILVVGVVEGVLRFQTSTNLSGIAHLVKDGIIYQSTDATCAAAAGANIARLYDISMTEATMAEAMHTTRYGTMPAQIIHGFEEIGLYARKVSVPTDELHRVRAPAILLVENTDTEDGHAVALIGYREGNADIWDPIHGRLHFSSLAFSEKWIGHAIEVSDEPF